MIKRSTINFWKMQGEGAWGIQRFLNMIHGYVYYTLYDHYIACAILVARTLSRFPKIFFKTVVIDFFGNRYHCKVITHENARKLLAVEEDIVLPTKESKKIIPWEIANKIILKHKDQLAIVDCPCRLEKKTAGKKYCEPIHTCIFYGKVGVDFVTSHMPRMNGHRATKEEILNLLELQQKNGKVFTVWFKDATGYRAGVLCCCCSCCCACVEVESLSRKNGIQGLAMTAPSGYSVSVDIERCSLCGKCVKTCPYGAMKIVEIDENKRLRYSKDLCMGCGICIDQCPNESLSLVVDSDKGVIFDVDSMIELTRKAISNPRL
ncbi:MAG: 4Fe-4S binding protein [Dehalococcoidales bacterium]|nr:4Fe-4S binding protein [Dehalococcoidales bacterium]